jgi:ATP-dependent protease ClpP protease subunit
MNKFKAEYIDYIHSYGLDIYKRTIHFAKPINQKTMCGFIKNLHILNNFNQEPINVLFSSEGGNWEPGMAAFDAIEGLKKSGTEINFYCTGQVSSMGPVLLQAATHRFCLPNTSFLIHYGTCALGDNVQYKESQAIMKLEQKQLKQMMEILGKKKDNIRKMERLIDLRQEVYWTPQEALKYNLIDKIVQNVP